MFSNYINGLIDRISESGELNGFEIRRSFDEKETVYPLSSPVLFLDSEEMTEECFLIGGLRLCRECLTACVLTDESLGGEYAKERAREALEAVLRLDTSRQICSVSAEKTMYDKQNFAYKVVMRFTLAEHGITG